MIKHIQKGFTLIELLIVIAVIGVLATVLLAALDPVDKLRAANDSKVQSDIGKIAQAQEVYATQNAAYATLAALQTAGELKSIPVPPTAAGYACANYSEAAFAVGGVTHYRYSCNLMSKKYRIGPPALPFWVYCTSTGKAGAVAAATTCP